MSRIHPAVIVAGVSILLVGGLVAYVVYDQEPTDPNPENRPLIVYCGAGLQKPVQAIAEEYTREYGQKVELQFGGSNTLLAKIKVTDDGDLYIPGDDSYINIGRSEGLVAESIPIATMHAVLLVAQGNPKKISCYDDLLRSDVKVGQANPDAAAIGKQTQEVFTKLGKWAALDEKTKTYMGTVNEVGTAVRAGSVDVGIVWDATAANYPEQEQIMIPELEEVTGSVAVGVVTNTKIPTAALKFARYMTAPEQGLPKFKESGFPDLAAGDSWAEVPELVLYSGSMLRPAIEKTVAEFQEREGVRVTAKYDGCGNLVSAMKVLNEGGRRGMPDMYFACDVSFMRQVQDSTHNLELFGKDQIVSGNQLVIGVQKGNPHHLQTLQDLAKPGLRLGVGHESQCAMGALTQETLTLAFAKQNTIFGQIQKNIKVKKASGDQLIPDLRSGALDAAIVYRSNLATNLDQLEGIPITGFDCAVPAQPLAIGKDTKYPRLMSRLMDSFQSEVSRQRFEDVGFVWQVGETTDE